MAKILCVTSGLPGMLYSSLELSRRLTVAGHDVVYASFPEVRETIVDHGLEFVALEPSRYQAFVAQDGDRSALRRLLTLRRRLARAERALAPAGFGEALQRLAPDLVLIDVEMHEHVVLALAAGVRLALLNTFVSIWRRPGMPPPHHGVRPGVGWKGSRIGIWLLWLELRLRKVSAAWALRARRVGCDRVSVLRRFAHAQGVDLAAETDTGQWLIPFTYRRLPVLSLHAVELEFPHQPLQGVHYVGPMVRASRVDRPVTEQETASLEAILERRRSANGRRRLIYAGFGSFFSTDIDLVWRLVGAVASRDDWELVLTLAGRVTPSELGGLPANVHAFAWVPQVRVLREADVAVTHGGANSMDECIVCGVPVLVYCGSETDMAGVGARAAHHGIGIVGDARRDDIGRIGVHLDRLLTDVSFAERVGRLRSAFTTYATDRVLEGVVESLIEAPSGASRL